MSLTCKQWMDKHLPNNRKDMIHLMEMLWAHCEDVTKEEMKKYPPPELCGCGRQKFTYCSVCDGSVRRT